MINQAPRPPDRPAPDSNRDLHAGSPPASVPGIRVPAPDAELERIQAEIRDAQIGAGVPGLGVLTGGQTGVDTFGALAALRAGLRAHVVFPHGMMQEDGPLPPARLRRLRGAFLHELASPESAARTWSCVRLSDAVVLLDPAGGEGCRETVLAAARLGRPLLDLGPAARPVSPEEIAAWLRQATASSRRPVAGVAPSGDKAVPTRNFVLQIAGCRASQLTAAQVRPLLRQIETAISGAKAWFQK